MKKTQNLESPSAMPHETREYKVLYRPIAERDLKNIASYIALDLGSPKASRNTIERIGSAIRAIQTLPESGRLIDEERLDGHTYRKYATGNYWIIYQIDEAHTAIQIERILHQRQDISPRIYYEINLKNGSIT